MDDPLESIKGRLRDCQCFLDSVIKTDNAVLEYAQKVQNSIKEILKEKGAKLPNIALTDGRKAYLDYLRYWSYDEDDVLPLIDTHRITNRMQIEAFGNFQKSLKSDNPELIKWAAFFFLCSLPGIKLANDNLLLDALANRLADDLKKIGIVTQNFYAGVFPTNSCNAQATVFKNQNLILIDTGLMETVASAAMSTFSEETKLKKIGQLAQAIEKYVEHLQRPDPTTFSDPTYDWTDTSISLLTNSVEEFVIAHELGHLELGHIKDNRTRNQLSANGKVIQVAAKSKFEEFEADQWAFGAIIKRAKCAKAEGQELALRIALAGPIVFLTIAYLIERAQTRVSIKINDEHPPARSRLYIFLKFCNTLGIYRETGLGDRFYKLGCECCDSYFT